MNESTTKNCDYELMITIYVHYGNGLQKAQGLVV